MICKNTSCLTAADTLGEAEGLLVGAVLIDGESVGCALTVGDDETVGPVEGFIDIVGAAETVGEAEGALLGLTDGTSVGDTVAKNALKRV